MEYTFHVVNVLSVLTVIGQLLSLALIICLLLERTMKNLSPLVVWCSRHGLLLMCIVAVTATIGSLFFSEIAGWTPCKLCWLQRIFMYPQVVLLLLALWKNDRGIAPYILILSCIGLIIAAGHYGEQLNAALNPLDPSIPCDASGVSCAKTPIFQFGYITIPLMAATAFMLNILGSVSMMRSRS